MQKETEDFYLEHKDKTWELPKFPDTIDETDAIAVTKWILTEMYNGNMGWIEINLMNVKGGEFMPFAWHHMGQIETQTVDLNNLYTKYQNPSHEGAYGCTLFGKNGDRTDLKEDPDVKGEFSKEMMDTVPNITAWWDGDFPAGWYNKIRFVKLDPKGSVGPHSDNINHDKEEILNEKTSIWPILVSLKEPGKKCHTVVEGFGTIPIREGRMYIVNPYRKHVMVNTSETEPCVHMNVQATFGWRFEEFTDCLCRSFFEIEGRLGKDYLRAPRSLFR